MNTIASRMNMFEARREQWPQMSAFVESFCRGAGVSDQRCLTTTVVLEKLFMHTVKHAQRVRSTPPIWVTLAASEGKVSLTYEDRAPPFNPVGRRKVDANSSIGPQTAGLLGMLVQQADYAYLFGRNRIHLTIE